jgi:hypothetical protein
MIYAMKKIFISILLGCALVATSCQNLLDIPQKGVSSYSNFFGSDADAKAALTNVYASFAEGVASCQGGWIFVPQLMLLNYSADDVLAAGGNSEDHGDFRVFCEFRYDETTGAIKTLYNHYASSIYACNFVISNFSNENRNGDEPKYSSAYTKQCVEEARVMRAYLHLMMAISWYRPYIVDRILEGDELPTQAESQSQVLEWVISECNKAITSGSLPARTSTADKDATARMTVGFAQFIAGKAAMFNNDPATARKYLGDLINSGKYALVPSEEYWTNFHIDGDGNSEKIFESNYIADANFTSAARGRWMTADVLCWRTDALGSVPSVCENIGGVGGGWNGGAIQEDFAKKFLEHDGKSPRRLATFLTEDEWLYEMDWSGSKVNDGTLEQKKLDPARGIAAATGIYSHGPYFEWKMMVYHNPPKILTGGKPGYHADNVPSSGANSNQKNYAVARYAEALLLYAEACIGSGEEAAGLKALQDVQKRSGSGKISNSLTFQDVMDEKQYELWFEGCRFHDLVRWAAQGKVDLNEVFNTRYGGIHEKIPTVYDEFEAEYDDNNNLVQVKKPHKLYTTYSKAHYNKFEVGKHEYFPFPLDVKNGNPNLKDVGGWAYLNPDTE